MGFNPEGEKSLDLEGQKEAARFAIQQNVQEGMFRDSILEAIDKIYRDYSEPSEPQEKLTPKEGEIDKEWGEAWKERVRKNRQEEKAKK